MKFLFKIWMYIDDIFVPASILIATIALKDEGYFNFIICGGGAAAMAYWKIINKQMNTLNALGFGAICVLIGYVIGGAINEYYQKDFTSWSARLIFLICGLLSSYVVMWLANGSNNIGNWLMNAPAKILNKKLGIEEENNDIDKKD